MNDYAYFYNSNDGDRKYDADSFSNWLKQLFTDGIINGGMYVRANGDMTLTVNTGTGLIGGKVKIFKEETMLTLDTASGTLNRKDSIVLRRDDERRDFYITVIKGTEASKPIAPNVVRSGNIYDLKLAEVYVGRGVVAVTQASVTDCRADRKVCGWIIGNTGTIEAEQMLEQINTTFNEWFTAMKDQLSTDAGGNLQKQINEIKGKISYGTVLPTTGKEGDIFILIEQ